ncbi:SCO2523 family variant P-loop protein [Nocardia sp. NPDC004068]|uniref:SCO2523 family variant P-loop protein n=1 Tax=Nocardia sp. NPDC004068 TaxID=3364303 RepID=UPI003677662C
MLVFSTSDKGGTGRSVTSCNIAYRLSLTGRHVAYLDFDFGSPTSGAVFEIAEINRGTDEGDGLHCYLLGESSGVGKHDVRKETGRHGLRAPRHPYRLVLYAGDRGGGEFPATEEVVQRCTELLVTCEQEFDVTFVDLSAGRSAALEIALGATAQPQLRETVVRWLVFHRWTSQHIVAAHALVHGPHGVLNTGEDWTHDRPRLESAIRYVRTAVPSITAPAAPGTGTGPQWAWLHEQHAALRRLAAAHELGSSVVLGETPVEPVLQWREQVILDADVQAEIANADIVLAFTELAEGLVDDAVWERL